MVSELDYLMQSEIIQDALKFAAKAHIGQTVTGTNLPYLLHVTSVSFEMIVAVSKRHDVSENLAIQCSLLHDVIEDTPNTYDEVKKYFGQKVADGVQALTKDKNLDKAEQMQDSLWRIKKQPCEIWMVKMADRIINLNEPPDFWSNEKIKMYHLEAVQIYQNLKSADSYLANRLESKIREYEEYFV